jgi:hypothetical protein
VVVAAVIAQGFFDVRTRAKQRQKDVFITGIAQTDKLISIYVKNLFNWGYSDI